MTADQAGAQGTAADRAGLTHRLAAARLWASHHYPYLASALFASPVIPAPELGRLVIDRWWRVHADPAVVAQTSVDQLGGELLHLVSHVLRDHAGRADRVGLAEEAEVHHWVDAADAEIDDDFPTDLDRVESRVAPPDLGCQPGRLAEEYYRQGLVRESEVNDCGSGAHGQVAGWEPPPPAQSGGSGVDDADQRLIRRRVAAEVANAPADTVGAGLRQWADQELGSRVDWRRELAARLRRSVTLVAGAVDYTYQRPSRRAASSPSVILPALRRPGVEVAVICDTSASVTDHQLGLAVAEIDGLLAAIGTRSVTVLAVDTAVNAVSRVARGGDVVLAGGGGTELGAGLEAVAELRPRPQVVVVVTDGFTPWPDQPPAAQVVVALLDTDVGVAPPTPPSWAHTVLVPAPAR